jgi:hypothetical protein
MLQQDETTRTRSPCTSNSPGGHADSGFAIYDFMRFVKPPVRTIVTGMCASAAVLPFLAVGKERRYSLPNARFLLHQPSTMVMGSASDVAINAEEIVKLRERYNAIVGQETGKSVEQVTSDADRDFGSPRPGEGVRAGREDREGVRRDGKIAVHIPPSAIDHPPTLEAGGRKREAAHTRRRRTWDGALAHLNGGSRGR